MFIVRKGIGAVARANSEDKKKSSSSTKRVRSEFKGEPPRKYMSTLPTNDGGRSPRLYPKKTVVLQFLCEQPYDAKGGVIHCCIQAILLQELQHHSMPKGR